MKKSILLFSTVAVAITLLFTQCMKWTKEDTYDFDLQFLTEDYKPLNYVENSAITGLAPAVLAGIVDQLSIPCYVNVLPWNTAYALALKSDNAVLFSTIMNAERKDLFKWAGPIISLDCMFYTSSQSNIVLNSLDDAKTVARIGILKDYAIEQYLTAKGFTNFTYCADDNDAFDKLLKGQIDLFPADRITASAALTELGKSIYSVTPKLTIKTDLMYFAFNKNIPDRVVSDFQKIIDQYKTDGTLKTLTQQFLGTSDFPGILQIYTEQYPPLTYRNNSGEITGFGTDIVSEIMQRNQVFADIQLTSWNNGYELALDNPNVCLFTTDRTAIRENLFQWVGPIGTNTTWFYTKAGSGITITSLEDAKNLSSVGTVTSWFSDQYLKDQGFTNLVSNVDPAAMAKKLMDGEIDAFVCTSVTFPSILMELGYGTAEVTQAFSLMSSDYYIAFSKSTSATIVNQWQTALDAVKTDGTYDAISQKWFH